MRLIIRNAANNITNAHYDKMLFCPKDRAVASLETKKLNTK